MIQFVRTYKKSDGSLTNCLEKCWPFICCMNRSGRLAEVRP